MKTSAIAVIVVVIGLAVSFVVYNSVLDSTTEETSEVVVSDDTFSSSFTYNGDSGDYFICAVVVDDQGAPLSQCDCSYGATELSLSREGVVDITVVQSNYTSIEVSFTVLDESEHVLKFYFLMSDEPFTLEQMENYTSWSSLEMNTEGGEAVLLLTQNTFWAALVACVVFIIFAVVSMMIYAGGSRR